MHSKGGPQATRSGQNQDKINIFWFRRDLRLEDNVGLSKALQAGLPVLPIFIFDPHILDRLEDRADGRVEFIHSTLASMQKKLQSWESSLWGFVGDPTAVFRKLMAQYRVQAVYTNHDYEPYAIERDAAVERVLHESRIPLHTFKDQVIFERNQVQKDQGGPYTVFTPYSKKWKSQLRPEFLDEAQVEAYKSHFYSGAAPVLPALRSLGFTPRGLPFPEAQISSKIIKNYASDRDFPSVRGTSQLGVHLRFGTLSVRQCVRQAQEQNSEAWLNELIWREFFMQILFHFPHVENGPFRREYAAVPWRHDEADFRRWCRGETGFPIVDAGMRELNATGFMHNRVRMVTASFLCKHLMIDWRWGERYFAQKLLDFDLAANNGNWQWVAGCGCDAAPYFRIFNPELQTKRFDSKLEYIRKWIPELDSSGYPDPMVNHQKARERALQAYSVVKDPR